MTKSQVKAKIVEYIKVYNLRRRLINTHNKPMLEKEMDTLYFWYDVQAPHGVECSVFLFVDIIVNALQKNFKNIHIESLNCMRF